MAQNERTLNLLKYLHIDTSLQQVYKDLLTRRICILHQATREKIQFYPYSRLLMVK